MDDLDMKSRGGGVGGGILHNLCLLAPLSPKRNNSVPKRSNSGPRRNNSVPRILHHMHHHHHHYPRRNNSNTKNTKDYYNHSKKNRSIPRNAHATTTIFELLKAKPDLCVSKTTVPVELKRCLFDVKICAQ